MKILSEHKEYLSICTLVVYFAGILNYFIFYSFFGINIIPFLSLQEVLINTVIFLISVLLGVAVIICIVALIIHFFIKLIAKKSSIKFNDSLIFSVSLLAILSGFLGLLSLFFKDYSSYFLSVSTFTSIVCITFILTHSKVDFKIFLYFLMVFNFATFILVSSNNDAKEIITGKSTVKFKYVLDNDTVYTSNDSIYFIGETSTSIFLYNKPFKGTIIINRDHLIENSFN